jgi:HlyD family secretion protein
LRIDLESREVALGRLVKLGETGIVSASELLEAELNLKRTRVEIEQIDAEIVSVEERREADLERLELDLSILDKQRADQARRVAMSTVKAPRDGMIIDLVRDEGAVVGEGQALVTIAAADSFRVEAGVSDFYGPELKIGQRVRVSSSTSEFGGRLSRILPTADSARLDLFIELDDPSAPAFHMNLRVDIEIVTAEKPDVLKVRRGPALESAGKTELFVVEGGFAVRSPVQLGMSGRQVIEIVDGLEAGDRVIVSDTSAYEGLAEIRIR